MPFEPAQGKHRSYQDGLLAGYCAAHSDNLDEVRQGIADRRRRDGRYRAGDRLEPAAIPHVGTLREQLARVHGRTPEQLRRQQRGLGLARLLRDHWDELRPTVLDLLAPDIGRMVAAILGYGDDA
jgi:hypothetical protein